MSNWFQPLERELQTIGDGDSVAAYAIFFNKLDGWRNRLQGPERRVLEMLWGAALAYLGADMVGGDALHRRAIDLRREAQGAARRWERRAA